MAGKILTATAVVASAELFALESTAQLWKVSSEPGEGLTYAELGSKQAELLLSTSTCMDSKRKTLYFVGGKSNDDCNLVGVSTADGSVIVQQKLPDADDRDKKVPMLWKLACDEVNGKIYALGDYDIPPPAGSMQDFPPAASRTIWRFDAASTKLDSLASMPAYAYQIHQDSGTMRSLAGAVNTKDGQVSFLDNRRDVFDYGIYPGMSIFMYDTKTGKELSIREIGKEGMGTPFVQVYDSKLNRFFGMCTTETPMGLYVPASCWWTADKDPQIMEQLSDYTEGDTTICSVDVEGRLAFFLLQDKLSTVSLDTGKIVSQLTTRKGHWDLYVHQSTSSVLV